MVVQPGVLLGRYQIEALIGRGGMGEVYRARDTRLRRDVAVKVLPAAFTADAERMARFEREAHLLASLNHPHIATIHGLEEAESVRALVMELVEGPTLGERLRQGAMPLEEALAIARQMTEAIEYAHERGIVHRDLKPSNVKLTSEGAVKVLDFGLAKALEDAPPVEQDDSQSPTPSGRATRAGVILGTAAYMSPEQAKGKAADRRADVWAFGVVLYEMLSGQQAFTGETASETLAAVLKTEPEWSLLPASVPARVGRMLRRCLEKEPRRRVQAIGEARIVIEDALAGAPEETVAVKLVPFWRRALPWSLALLVTFLLGLWAPWRSAPQPESQRLSVELGADASLVTDSGPAAVLSPDGSVLAFVARKAAGEKTPFDVFPEFAPVLVEVPTQLYVRRLDQLQAAPLAGTGGARNPFFSPDGQWIGFFAGGKLKKVGATGGAAVTLCDAPQDRGGTWSEDGSILFTPGAQTGLWRVSSAGGAAEALTTPDPAAGETSHSSPQALPGGEAVLFTAYGAAGNFEDARLAANLVVQRLPGGSRKIVHRGGFDGRYLPSGHLVYMHEGTLFAAPFDLDRLETTGLPAPVLEGVAVRRAAQFAFSHRGTLVFVPGPSGGAAVPVQWMDREGKLQPLRAVPGVSRTLRFSPDGRRLALDILEGKNWDVWVYEWGRDTLSRLTFDPSGDTAPVWTPDGRRIAFSSARADQATRNLYWQGADGTGEAERLGESKNIQIPNSWHPSGKSLAFQEQNTQTSWDILILPLEGDDASGWKPGKPTVFLNSPFSELESRFSPDGRWLAYSSNESGRQEVYVRPFIPGGSELRSDAGTSDSLEGARMRTIPGPGGKWQISTAGGTWPKWSRSRRELFYRGEDERIMVSAYTVEGDSFRAEKPRVWSPGLVPAGPAGPKFDLHPDGERVAVLKASAGEAEARHDHVTLIQNFFDELARIAPPARR